MAGGNDANTAARRLRESLEKYSIHLQHVCGSDVMWPITLDFEISGERRLGAVNANELHVEHISGIALRQEIEPPRTGIFST